MDRFETLAQRACRVVLEAVAGGRRWSNSGRASETAFSPSTAAHLVDRFPGVLPPAGSATCTIKRDGKKFELTLPVTTVVS
jgi:hypothetical protein